MYIIPIVLTILFIMQLITGCPDSNATTCSDKAFNIHKNCIHLAEELNTLEGNEDLYTYKEREAMNNEMLRCMLFWYKNPTRADNCDKRLLNTR